LLERHGGSEPATAKQGIGNLVHSAAMLADEAAGNPDVLHEYVAERFDAIELAAVWLSGRERARAEDMVDKLMRWLAANPRRLIAIEEAFVGELAPTVADEPPVELRGRVDRLEADDQGRLVVVDLKTGSSAPSTEDTAEHAQLAAYQVAVEAGVFPQGDEPGGAEIVALGAGKSAVVRRQEALADTEDPAWAGTMVRRAAKAMAASTFTAVVNDGCIHCPVRASCPVSGKGRQVTE
jgi:RecB family exonuclease